MNFLIQTPLFLSPFLLFVLELIAGKYYLIQLGGSSSVWITLMLFFTVSLLLGYVYAALTTPKIHIAVLIVSSLYCFYLIVTQKTLFPFNLVLSDPVQTILVNASLNMGIFVVMLASASSLLPHWSNHPNPYRYYSLSNFGSLVGLLGYPFFIEPYISSRYQYLVWLILFLINISLIIYQAREKRSTVRGRQERLSLFFTPALYSTLSTAYFLVTTTVLSQTIGPFSLLWALPMAIYLFSFVVAFSYHRMVQFSFSLPVSLFFLLVTVALNTRHLFLGNATQYVWPLITQFFVNVVFHTAIYHLRPPKKQLTSYYVSIALGGAVASVLVSFIAPIILSEFHEFPILVVLCLTAFSLIAFQKFKRKTIAVQMVIISLLGSYGVWYFYRKPLSPQQQALSVVQTKSRSFYGFLNLVEITSNNKVVERRLFSGETIHGSQNYNGNNEHEPTMYYNRNTAIGLLFSKPFQNVGVIGLGVGTIAAYCKPGTSMSFYEINPQVINIANQKFSYLKNCTRRSGIINIVEGDARISLSHDPKKKYDLFIVDAFTDDAIPTHLLTKEALSLYFSHLTDNGVVALHISSKYLDLKPTMVVTANSLGLFSSFHSTPDANYVLISRTQPMFGTPEQASNYPKIKPWTDNFTNIFQSIKW